MKLNFFVLLGDMECIMTCLHSVFSLAT